MADRMPPYQMNTQNLMQNIISQQQMQQQPQQQQDSQMVAGLPNPEQHGRMWTLQNNYKGQPSADTNSTQMNQQMADLARNQALNDVHSSQVPIVQHIQQQYGQRAPTSASSFHDPQSSNPSPSIIPPNFSSMPMNAPQMKAGNQIQALASRPLHLIDRVSNQQNQHQPQTAMGLARMQQQQMGAQPGSSQPTPADMFSAANMSSVDAMHGSPHLGPQPLGPQMGHPNMMSGRGASAQKIPTLPELMQRREYLKFAIDGIEQGIQTVLTQSRGFPDEGWSAKLDKMRAELHSRKTLFVRMNQAIQQLTTNNNGVLGANLAHLNPMVNATGRPGVMQGGGASQQPWPQSSSPPSNFGMNSGAGSPPQIPGQTHPMNQQLSGQGGQMPQRPGGVPPRSGLTPQQGMPMMMQQNMNPQYNLSSVSNGEIQDRFVGMSTLGVAALEKSRFEVMYTSYCKNHNADPNLHVMLPDNRTVDLYNLHVQVFREGGAQSVNQRELWPVIGGRMGLIQFPGTETEPAKSGLGIAQQLAHVYKEHLQSFETAYVLTVRSRVTQKNPLSQQNGLPGSTPGPAGNMPHSTPRLPLPPQAMANAVRFVHMSVAEMRASGLPEQIIVAVDRYRPEIMRWQQARLMVAKANQQMNNPEAPNEQPGMSSAPQGAFPDQVSTAGPSMVTAPRGQSPMMPNGMQPPQMTEMKPAIQSGPILPPTKEQLAHAMAVIQSTKTVFGSRGLQSMQPQVVTDDQRMEYNRVLEQVYKMTRDIEDKLPMYYIVLRSDEAIRKLVAIVLMVGRQRDYCSIGSPQYIIGLATLRSMYMQVQKNNEEFEQRLQVMKAAVGSQHMGGLVGPHINRSSPHTVSKIPPSDEDASSKPDSFGAPSPKKVKTEDWDEEASEAFIKRHQEVDNLKTDEEPTAFLDSMKELVHIYSRALFCSFLFFFVLALCYKYKHS